MKKLRIARDLALPAEDFVESKFFIVGQSGRGKSGLLKVIEEGLVKAKLPFVVFDPAGVAWGIRSSIDGKGPGLDVLVIGGPHGDVRLDRRAGASTARSIVQANVSAIIDFSEEPKAAYREFLMDFCETIYTINDTSRLIIIDEAREVLPQTIRPDQTRAYDAVERLVRQGRNKGIGIVLVSQRMATVNKDVVTQCGTLFVFGLVGKPDHKTLREWVDEWSSESELEKFEEGLAALEPRECWIWSPQAFKLFRRVYVRPFETLHPDRTHLRKLGLLDAKPVTTDVSAIVSKLGAELERLGKEKDEKLSLSKIQKELSTLRAENERLRTLPRSLPAKSDFESREIVELRTRYANETKALYARMKNLKTSFEQSDAVWTRIRGAASTLTIALDDARKVKFLFDWPIVDREIQKSLAEIEKTPVDRVANVERKIELRERADAETEERKTVFKEWEYVDPEKKLPKGALRVLIAIASAFPNTISRARVATLAGMSVRSGTFTKYLSLLRQAGYFEERDDALRITKIGYGFASEYANATEGRFASIPPAGAELVSFWKSKLGGGIARILQVLVDHYPNRVDRESLAGFVEMTPRSGTYTKYLSILRRNGLIDETREGIAASSTLFPEV